MDQRQDQACGRYHDRGRDHQRALRRALVDQRAGRRLGDDPGKGRHRHHHADAGLVPFLFGQEVDGQIGSEAVAHVGEKEIQRIQRALDGGSGVLQTNPRAGMDVFPTTGRAAGSRTRMGACDPD